MNKKYFTYSLFIIAILGLSACGISKDANDISFQQAVAVWPADKQFEKNITIEFKTEFEKTDKGNVFLRLTGSSLYRIYLNREFIGHGPARAGHGYYRVDEWDLTEHLRERENVLTVEVAGYNVNSFYLLDQPSFLQAEVIYGNKVIAATSSETDDFIAIQSQQRVRKVPRYSFQRPFIEYYKIGLEDNNEEKGKMLVLENVGPKKLIPRRIPYPDFDIVKSNAIIALGKVEAGIVRDQYWRDRAVVNIGPKLGGFTIDELEYNPAIELQEMENSSSELCIAGSKLDSSNSLLKDGDFIILDMGTNLTGFIGVELQVNRSARLIVTFDEILQDNDVNFKRLGTIAALTYDLESGAGNLKLESFEPYTFRYAKIIVTEGELLVNDFYLREYANPDIKRASFESSDDRLNRIFAAGVETFRQNAVDIFMDCPHRERAGWLCDSYFTARVADDLSGNSIIEKNFYENFLLPDSFPHLPEGMLPMCYPADHNDSVFIPNWAMWFVVQLDEYLDRSLDRELVDSLETKVMALLDYFEPFKNEDGLLENLDSWIFVEWSAANRFVQDVNYPTNMLYAKTLDVAGKLYGKPELMQEAENIRNKIREQSWNGRFFIDNAVRNKDAAADDDAAPLIVTSNISEVCQYFAFYFDIASPDSYPGLWEKLSTGFGPNRQQEGLYPSVHPANSFVGNYLRLELLSRYNLRSQLLNESIDYFDYMANITGTLWENISPSASCNHGFASHVVHVFFRDVLGIADVDARNKIISFQISDTDLEFCKGQMPVGEELIKFQWNKTGNEIKYSFEVPEGYKVEIINNSKMKITG